MINYLIIYELTPIFSFKYYISNMHREDFIDLCLFNFMYCFSDKNKINFKALCFNLWLNKKN